MPSTAASPLYRLHEPAFRTQYAELKERCRAAGPLLPGTPGQLVPHDADGRRYWYRRHYPVPGAKPVWSLDTELSEGGDTPVLTMAKALLASQR